MSLLSGGDITNILGAIKQVTDQFFVTPCKYHLAGESVDRFNEDRLDQQFTDYDLLCLFEFSNTQGDEVIENRDGALNAQQVTATFNVEDLIAKGLINSMKMPKFDDTKDYMTINGNYYKIKKVLLDGPLQRQNVLVIVTGELQENYS